MSNLENEIRVIVADETAGIFTAHAERIEALHSRLVVLEKAKQSRDAASANPAMQAAIFPESITREQIAEVLKVLGINLATSEIFSVEINPHSMTVEFADGVGRVVGKGLVSIPVRSK